VSAPLLAAARGAVGVVVLPLGLSLGPLGCAGAATDDAWSPRSAARAPSGTEWRAARQQLEQLRARYAPPGAYTMNVTLELTEPYTGQRVRARGAVAVSPAEHALRMIMLGPGGTTALDLWVCQDRFRFVLPAADLSRRGDARTPRSELRGLPVEFLRWWLLAPLGGQLLFTLDGESGRRYVLRDGAAVVDVRAGPGLGLEVERRSEQDRERVQAEGPGCASVRYDQASTGIDLWVRCEQLDRSRTPPAEAFADPDDPTQSCIAEQGSRP
jgi:hypothetical protein